MREIIIKNNTILCCKNLQNIKKIIELQIFRKVPYDNVILKIMIFWIKFSLMNLKLIMNIKSGFRITLMEVLNPMKWKLEILLLFKLKR